MIGDRYTTERELGRGGMGAVWLGRDDVLDRPVAIKRVGLLPGGESPDQLRAEREARIAASLNHPHVIGVYDLVTEDDGQWLVMEYFDGATLADLVRTNGPLPAERLAPILYQVALALSAAHDAGVVHRDVKPSNILVDDEGLAKIGDFGIARTVTDEALTSTGLVTGSPSYLAPEVASGRHAGPPADVWSFGATAFHALSGRPPYEVGDNVLGALYRIVNEPPPRLAEPGVMGPLLEATMAHQPESRWTMHDVARFLQGLVDTAAPTVTPAPVPAALPADAPEPTPTATPVPAPEPTPAGARRAVPADRPPRRRLGVLPALVSLVVAALVVTIVVLALSDDPQRTTADPRAGATSSSTSSGGSGSPSTQAPDAATMEQFARDYVATASSDPTAGFDELTPEYQQRSGGFGGYRKFWGSVVKASVLEVTADPQALTVTYDYTYVLRGEGRRTETVTLRLERQDDDGFLIAGQVS